jgi:ubiquinone biosynthesis protein COQ9
VNSPFAERERERLIAALLPDVAFEGWTARALRQGARRLGMPEGEAAALFPRGAADMVAAFSQWADRQMLERLAQEPAEAAGLSRRVARALQLRFAALLPWREAVRRGLAVLALPHNAPLALRLICDTADAICRGVDDRATDFSFYTKRATLVAICAAATLYWLDDRSPDFAATQAFIDRRLADVRRLGGLRAQAAAVRDRLPNPLLLLRPLR